MEKIKAFLKRKNIIISAKRYGIDALGAMAQGLFASLLIGTIISTIGEQAMSTTKDGKALYLHCLPADINGVSCKDGEVEASVFDRYRDPLYKEASYKPYIIAAMILLAKQKDITGTLEALADKATPRHFGE